MNILDSQLFYVLKEGCAYHVIVCAADVFGCVVGVLGINAVKQVLLWCS